MSVVTSARPGKHFRCGGVVAASGAAWYAAGMIILILLAACLPSSSDSASAGKDSTSTPAAEDTAACPAGLRVELRGHDALQFAYTESDGIESAVWALPLSDSWLFQCPKEASTLHVFWSD